MLVVGVIGSGAMGSALGARFRDGGVRVAHGARRTQRSVAAACGGGGLEDAGSLAALLREADVVLSVVPPEASVDVAAAIARDVGDARPLVADLNAVSPATMERVAETLAPPGSTSSTARSPDRRRTGPGTTRVYLSGARAGEIASLPLDGVERIVVGETIGLASAVKMCTASVYKGRVALLAQALRTAYRYGVVDHVLDDLADTGLAIPSRTGATLGRASAKAWRYVAEMKEIAATQASAGLTPDLFEALAVVYAELAALSSADAPEDVPDDIALADVLRSLSEAAGGRIDAEGPSTSRVTAPGRRPASSAASDRTSAARITEPPAQRNGSGGISLRSGSTIASRVSSSRRSSASRARISPPR